MKRGTQIILGVMMMVAFASCSSSEESAKIQVSLIDAPAGYDAVIIDLLDVQVNGSVSGDTGWQSLPDASAGEYDLLKLTNGEEAFLGEVELPEGKLGQVRLILGDNNRLTVDGQTTNLTVPSGSQSGLKLSINSDIVGGVTYKLIIDFDAAKSIVSAGSSGKYNLKPVVRAQMEATTGSIAGTITPAETAVVVYAIVGQDSVSSYPDEAGNFLIRALAEGAYTVSAVPDPASGLEAVVKNDISVAIGEKTDAGAFDFAP